MGFSRFPYVCPSTGLTRGCSIDNTFRKALDRIKLRLKKKDNDFQMLMIGNEGSGKSVLAMQICSYIDPTFNLDRVCFTAEDFKNQVMKGKPGQAIMLDESSDLSVRSSLSKLNKMMNNLFAQQRQLRLFCLIVIPSVYMLDRYSALHRSEAMIYTEIGKNNRHIFNVLNRDNKLRIILEGKKTMDTKKVILKYRDDIPYATFTNSYALIDEGLYRTKKLTAFKKMGEDDFDTVDKGLTLRNEVIYKILHQSYKLNSYKIAELFLKHNISLTRSGIRNILVKCKKEEDFEKYKEVNKNG